MPPCPPRVNPNTLVRLAQDGQTAVAKQNGAGVSVMVKADAGLPENVVHLPLHIENAALGALMDTIELAGSIMQNGSKTSLPQRSVWAIWVLPWAWWYPSSSKS